MKHFYWAVNVGTALKDAFLKSDLLFNGSRELSSFCCHHLFQLQIIQSVTIHRLNILKHLHLFKRKIWIPFQCYKKPLPNWLLKGCFVYSQRFTPLHPVCILWCLSHKSQEWASFWFLRVLLVFFWRGEICKWDNDENAFCKKREAFYYSPPFPSWN